LFSKSQGRPWARPPLHPRVQCWECSPGVLANGKKSQTIARTTSPSNIEFGRVRREPRFVSTTLGARARRCVRSDVAAAPSDFIFHHLSRVRHLSFVARPTCDRSCARSARKRGVATSSSARAAFVLRIRFGVCGCTSLLSKGARTTKRMSLTSSKRCVA
jgi:hypothetical protein